MTTDGPQHPDSRMLLALGAIVVAALIITGDAIVSVATNTEIIAVRGAPVLAPVFAIGLAIAAWVWVVARGIKRRGSIGSAAFAAVCASAAYLLGLAIGMLPKGLAGAGSALTHALVGGYALVVFFSAVLVAAGVLTIGRAGTGTPRWRWENKEEDE